MKAETLATGTAREINIRRGQRLEYLTIGWNSAEAVIAIGAGIVAGSISLVGFGFDSVIESLSGAILLWRLFAGERAERHALKLVGTSLLVLAVYVAFDAGKSLFYRESPEASYAGIGLAILSLIVMPVLARAKRRVAAELNSRALAADSKQTEICAYLSAILLVGLVLNALFGWWWADPLAALAMIPLITKEGLDALRGKTCCGNESCH